MIFLRDVLTSQPHEPDITALARLRCAQRAGGDQSGDSGAGDQSLGR